MDRSDQKCSLQAILELFAHNICLHNGVDNCVENVQNPVKSRVSAVSAGLFSAPAAVLFLQLQRFLSKGKDLRRGRPRIPLLGVGKSGSPEPILPEGGLCLHRSSME